MEERSKDAALRLVVRFIEGIRLENHSVDGKRAPSRMEVYLAAEVFASLHRRIARDLGVTKERMRAVMEVASRVAGEAYEGSGQGRAVRAQAEPKADSAFPGKQWDLAEACAVEAIRNAIKKGE